MKISIISLIFACLLSACTTIDPYSGQNKTSNTTKGSSIGAVTGALIGASTSSSNDRGRGAITGALVGAALGGGVGWYMDKQEAKLRQNLKNTGVQIERIGNEIRLIMPSSITFDTGRSNLNNRFHETLNSVATVLTEYNKTRIDISGHTDSIGSFQFNQILSEARAASVGNYLIDHGITTSRIVTFGYGERYPTADNINKQGRAKNRRVEIELRAM